MVISESCSDITWAANIYLVDKYTMYINVYIYAQ